MRLTESNRKYILLAIVGIIVIGIFTAKILASKQDEQFAYEDMLYMQASQQYEAGNYIDALSMVSELLETQPNSEAANYLGGLISANTGEYKQSAILLQKVMDVNPYKSEEDIFMLQFGEILFMAERYEDAKVVLEKCREWGWAPEALPTYQERVADLLTQIENM